MSTTITSLIDRALVGLGPGVGSRRYDRPAMLQHYNTICTRITVKLKALEADFYRDVVANEPRYAYPEERVQIIGIRFAKNNAPASLDDYYWLGEKFSEDFRAATNWHRPTAHVYGYYARAQWFELLATPVEDIVDGMIVSTRPKHTIITAEDGALMELPDFLDVLVCDGMQIEARLSGRERAAAMSDLERWYKDVEEMRAPIEDPSDDRRSSLRPPGGGNPFGGMR